MKREITVLAAGCGLIAAVTAVYRVWLAVTNPTTVALSFLLVVLIVATASTRRVAVGVSLLAFACFNFFFLPPVGTFTIAKPDDWVALFALLTVSIVASHLSSQARRRAREVLALNEQKQDADVARRSAEIKSALLESLSHDLKTPLTAATVAASNLTAPWLTEEQRREQLDIVLTEMERLKGLFQNVVDMASIEAHALSAEPEWVQPAEIIEAASRQVGVLLDHHPIDITGLSDRGFVRLDPRLTSAALVHVLENAAAYSPDGSPISIDLAVADGALRIAVRDRGGGLSPDELERVFERFYRGAGVRAQRFGSGMGLAITRGLLATEGGRVWAENHHEGGSVFTLEIPIAYDAAVTEASE